MNDKKQIEYWLNGATEDLKTAELLVENNRLLHGLFWCHLSIEKIMKAHVVRCTSEIPPKTHNLIWLLDKTDLQLSVKHINLLGELMIYQLEGRYPDRYPKPPGKNIADDILELTKDLYQWLVKKF